MDSILQKALRIAMLAGFCAALFACKSTGENEIFEYVYPLSPTDSYSKGEAECEKEAELLATQELDVESVEILKATSAMKVDMDTGKSSVECTIIVAPPDFAKTET